MADIQVKITPQAGLAATKATAESLDQLARKRRILAQVAQSRRARESSNIDDKSAAIRARIQRRLAAQRQASAATPAQGVEAVWLAEADRKHQHAADSQRTLPEAEEVGDHAFVQEGRDSLAHHTPMNSGGLRFMEQGQVAAAEALTSRRILSFRNQAAASNREMQSEIARLQTKAQAEKERADVVAALLENVLSSSTSSLIKHQARLEAMQAQINALQGR